MILHDKTLSDVVAWQLSQASSDDIAKFFDTFCAALLKDCDSRTYAEMQIHYVAKALKPESRELLGCFGEHVK